ncbi:MAG: hypothetical protein C4562_02400 [Actinobacteria bacterium]|nr:MAG: hypothetical protein C4562_02400 [Actinomycetota bacterium]
MYNRIGALAKLAEASSDSAKGELKKTLKKIDKGLRQSITDLQRIVSPKEIPDDDVEEDLFKKICNNHQKLFNQKIKYMNSSQKPIDLDKRFSNYRWDLECILQECLNNAGKHSGAKNIDVKLAIKNDTLTLSVKDDGKGLKTTELKDISPEHLGFKGIAERVKKLNGGINISSNGGTRIEVKISC